MVLINRPAAAAAPLCRRGSAVARRPDRRTARSLRPRPIPRFPNVVVLATGGTIAGAAGSDVQAGYTSGQVGVEQLLAAVPQAKKLANLSGEQISNIGSQDMNDEVWLKLATRVNEILARPDVDGRRHHARHGHDRGDRVLPESRRQVDEAGGADGVDASVDGAVGGRSAQLLQRGRRRRERQARRHGRDGRRQRLDPWRVVADEDEHHRGADLHVAALRPDRHRRLRRHRVVPRAGRQEHVDSEFSVTPTTMLPRVDVIMATENMDGALINAAAAAGAKGIVIAGVGNGNMTQTALDALAGAGEAGHRLRALDARHDGRGRSQRRGQGRQPAASSRRSRTNPQKSRVLLRLALLKTNDPSVIQRYFDEY